MPSMVRLYHHPFCAHSRFARLILGEFGIEPELIEENVWERRRDFLRLTADGATPGCMPGWETEVILLGARDRASWVELARALADWLDAGQNARVPLKDLAATLNSVSFLWRTAPAATELEGVVLDWTAKLLGLPDGWHGHIEDTASTGTMAAMIAARASSSLTRGGTVAPRPCGCRPSTLRSRA